MGFIEEHNLKYADFQPFHHRNNYSRELVAIGRNVHIGDNVFIGPYVTIYDDVYIGDDCVIDSGCVIGAPGFSIHLIEGKAVALKQVGGVRIGNGCEIGANVCIDRASLEGVRTTIGNNVFIDNFVHCAHNIDIRDNVRIAPHVTIGGSVIIGERTWISMGVSIKDHVNIGADCFVTMGSIVTEDLSDRKRLNSFSKTRVTDVKEDEY